MKKLEKEQNQKQIYLAKQYLNNWPVQSNLQGNLTLTS